MTTPGQRTQASCAVGGSCHRLSGALPPCTESIQGAIILGFGRNMREDSDVLRSEVQRGKRALPSCERRRSNWPQQDVPPGVIVECCGRSGLKRAAGSGISEASDVPEVLRTGTGTLLAQPAEAEVSEWIDARDELTDEQGRHGVVRNGYSPERQIVTLLGRSPSSSPACGTGGPSTSRSSSLVSCCRRTCGSRRALRS
jgi:hypothetical protein